MGERAFSVTRGDALLFHPGQDHELLEASPDFDLYVIGLTPAFAERGDFQLTAGLLRQPLQAEPLGRVEAELMGLNEVADSTATETRLVGLLSSLMRQARRSPALTRRAVASLSAEPHLSTTLLAARLRTARSVLSRRFSDDLGVTLVEYRARHKLMKFIALADQGLALTQAAFQAGFGSYAQCHRVFKRTLGCAAKPYFEGQRALLDDTTVSHVPRALGRGFRFGHEM